MRYLLNMTLSGSTMLLLYLAVKHGAGTRLSASWRYVLLKAAVIYYLVPLPFLKRLYRNVGDVLFPDEFQSVVIWQRDRLVLRVNDHLYVNTALGVRVTWFAVWMAVAGSVLMLCGMKYLCNRRKLFAGSADMFDGGDPKAEEIKGEYGIRRRVRCCECNMERNAFALGLFRPLIFYKDMGDDRDNELILRHEMIHIKRLDMLWKVLMTLVRIVHWYNPLAWWMSREMEQVCELSCDDRVLLGRTDEDKMQYAKLLLRASGSPIKSVYGETALSGAGKGLWERMENAMRKGMKKWGKWVSAGVAAAGILLNSLTVYAYDEVNYIALSAGEENPDELAEDFMNADHAFVAEGADNPFAEVILYETEFVDEEGNIYPVDEVNTASSCSHAYISGQIIKHNLNSTGGCTVTYFEAQRCTKCGIVVRGNYIMTLKYPVCVH